MLEKLWKAPGLHFVLVGALFFLASLRSAPDAPPSAETEPITVSATRVGQARDAFLAKYHREPTAEETAGIVRHLIDEEVLLRHALALGMDQQEPVQRRLAQIAAFVSEDPSETGSLPPEELAERAAEAKRLGLHHDDLVVRRMLVDSARRLIRAAVRTREPSDEALEDHLARHPGRFQLAESIAFDWRYVGDDTVQSSPLLAIPDLERSFGRDFVANLETSLDGTRMRDWQGPFRSRNGTVEVRVTDHLPERTASLDDVRGQVRHEVIEQLADRWLEARLEQLREGVEIQLPKDPNLPTLAKLSPDPTPRPAEGAVLDVGAGLAAGAVLDVGAGLAPARGTEDDHDREGDEPLPYLASDLDDHSNALDERSAS